MKKNPNTFVISGALMIAANQIIAHYFNIPDVINGGLMGIGIGLLTVALIVKRKKTIIT
ncbi:hypothetical protein GYB57_12780 [bacterium]|jgi:hypothetical protein|nr:hypothetical protein [bacterium]